MNNVRRGLGMLAALALCAAAIGSARAQGTTWQLSWSDEFNGTKGAAPDPANWTYDLGAGGWGNNELEYYTDSRSNSFLDGNGNLVIQAVKKRYRGAAYTSARLKTQSKFDQTYGRFEARIKLPYGQGIWPAFWMLGSDITTVGWPGCGELDIMENIGREPGIVHGTAHGPGYSGANGIGNAYTLPGGTLFKDGFHVFAIEWEPAQIRWYVDGALYHTLNTTSLPPGSRWVFDHPFFLILNVAVGGYWPGNPDKTTVFPQTMLVDYVRVYTGI